MAPFADAHMHLFARGYHPGPDVSGGSDVDRYEAIMEAHDITAALVVGYEGEGIDPDNNAYLRSLAVQRPWMSTVAHLPVSPPPALDHLEKLLAAGHSGIALHCPDANSAHAVAGWPEGSWELLADRGALVSFNATPRRILACLSWFAPTRAASFCSPTSVSRVGISPHRPRTPRANSCRHCWS
jgi:hypothetical protein